MPSFLDEAAVSASNTDLCTRSCSCAPWHKSPLHAFSTRHCYLSTITSCPCYTTMIHGLPVLACVSMQCDCITAHGRHAYHYVRTQCQRHLLLIRCCSVQERSGKEHDSSLLSVPHPMMIPGGRFREMYYWDAFWIVKGLLASGMAQSAVHVAENIMHLVEQHGLVPNGCRVRS